MAWNIGSRCFLLVINAVTFVLAIIMLSYAASGFVAVGSQKVHGHVTNPFAFVIAFATILMVVSMLGIAGGCCAASNDGESTPGKWRGYSNRALMVYFACCMFCIAGLLYGTMLCFVWADKAEDIIDTYWDQIALVVDGEAPEQIAEYMHQNANAGGVVCLVAMFVNVACVHCSAVLMGYQYTAKKTVLTINIFGLLLGVVTMIVAFLPASQEVGVQNSWLPEFIGALGGILLCNAVSLSVIGVLLLGFAIFCMTDADAAGNLLLDQWELVKVRFYDVCPDCEVPTENTPEKHAEFKECCADKAALSVWHNLSVLGICCTALLLCVFGNAVGSFYLWRKLRLQLTKELEDGEVDGLQDGVSRQTAVDRADKYRTDDPNDDL